MCVRTGAYFSRSVVVEHGQRAVPSTLRDVDGVGGYFVRSSVVTEFLASAPNRFRAP